MAQPKITILDGLKTAKEVLVSRVGTALSYVFMHVSVPYGLALTRGWLDGHIAFDKFGERETITTGQASAATPVIIQNYPGKTGYDYSTTDDITSFSCTGTSTGTVEFTGLDGAGNLVTQEKALNGQTTVILDTPLKRIFRGEYTGATDLDGDIYVYINGATTTGGIPDDPADGRLFISQNDGQTQMAMFTIPTGYVGFLHRGFADIGTDGGAFSGFERCKMAYRSRRDGKTFIIKKKWRLITSGSTRFEDVRPFKDYIPAGVDIEVVCLLVSATMDVTAGFDIELIPEDQV